LQQNLREVIASCDSKLAQMVELLGKLTLTKGTMRVKWLTYGQIEMSRLSSQLEPYKDTLNLALQMATM
jgi:hypothetical protein